MKRNRIATAQDKSLKDRALERTLREQSAIPDVRTFKVTAPTVGVQPEVKQSISLQEQLNKERVREVQFKNRFRTLLAIFFAFLLAGQNIAVFAVLFRVVAVNQLKDLQIIFSALMAATLTETYFITKIIINFVFSTTDYNSDKKQIVQPIQPPVNS